MKEVTAILRVGFLNFLQYFQANARIPVRISEKSNVK
jgi:hypothetical protein